MIEDLPTVALPNNIIFTFFILIKSNINLNDMFFKKNIKYENIFIISEFGFYKNSIIIKTKKYMEINFNIFLKKIIIYLKKNV